MEMLGQLSMDDFIEVTIPETNNLTIDQIRALIEKLETTEEGESLRNAMSELKVALKQNPAACSLMLEEDIGLCVKHLKRMVNKDILAELTEKTRAPKTAKVVLTQDVLDNLTMDDLK